MTAHALIEVTCPSCGGRFVEQARLLRAGGAAWCPECTSLFPLDAGDASTRRMLDAAKVARRQRKARIATMRQSWREAVPGERLPTPTDALRKLDALLDELEALVQSQTRDKSGNTPR